MFYIYFLTFLQENDKRYSETDFEDDERVVDSDVAFNYIAGKLYNRGL